MKKFYPGLLPFYFLILFFFAGCSAGQEDLPILLEKGSQAPDFSLISLNDEIVNFKKDFDGKKTLLVFWASWCVSCKEGMRVIEDAYKDSKNRGFNVVAVNVYQDKRQVNEFANELGLTFPILLDKEGEVAEVYNVFAVPVSYIIDSSGIINDKHIGDLSAEEIKSIIEKYWS